MRYSDWYDNDERARNHRNKSDNINDIDISNNDNNSNTINNSCKKKTMIIMIIVVVSCGRIHMISCSEIETTGVCERKCSWRIKFTVQGSGSSLLDGRGFLYKTVNEKVL